jgi:hypothetical protein
MIELNIHTIVSVVPLRALILAYRYLKKLLGLLPGATYLTRQPLWSSLSLSAALTTIVHYQTFKVACLMAWSGNTLTQSNLESPPGLMGLACH